MRTILHLYPHGTDLQDRIEQFVRARVSAGAAKAFRYASGAAVVIDDGERTECHRFADAGMDPQCIKGLPVWRLDCEEDLALEDLRPSLRTELRGCLVAGSLGETIETKALEKLGGQP